MASGSMTPFSSRRMSLLMDKTRPDPTQNKKIQKNLRWREIAKVIAAQSLTCCLGRHADPIGTARNDAHVIPLPHLHPDLVQSRPRIFRLKAQ